MALCEFHRMVMVEEWIEVDPLQRHHPLSKNIPGQEFLVVDLDVQDARRVRHIMKLNALVYDRAVVPSVQSCRCVLLADRYRNPNIGRLILPAPKVSTPEYSDSERIRPLPRAQHTPDTSLAFAVCQIAGKAVDVEKPFAHGELDGHSFEVYVVEVHQGKVRNALRILRRLKSYSHARLLGYFHLLCDFRITVQALSVSVFEIKVYWQPLKRRR
mmetsp:Transcript_911/g.2053  ORF Transcript_911/g.2053 Transcript_911/m.2053 type:complete len:214 (-) Transcript_911:1582-2223(-)